MKKFTNINPKWNNINENKLFRINESTAPPLNVDKTDVAKFVSKLFESREMAHMYHLKVTGDMGSLGKHEAMQGYYEGILESIDDLVEIYQGQYILIKNYDVIDTSDSNTKDTIEYFTELGDFIKSERKCFNAEDTHYFNIIDDILVLIYKTLYKLKYNK
jgi:hypothetical protein